MERTLFLPLVKRQAVRFRVAGRAPPSQPLFCDLAVVGIQFDGEK